MYNFDFILNKLFKILYLPFKTSSIAFYTPKIKINNKIKLV